MSPLDKFSVPRDVDGKHADLVIWDPCRAEDDSDSSPQTLPGVNVFVLCFSLASRTSCLSHCPGVSALQRSGNYKPAQGRVHNRDCLCFVPQ